MMETGSRFTHILERHHHMILTALRDRNGIRSVKTSWDGGG